jgi:hypothetical protein
MLTGHVSQGILDMEGVLEGRKAEIDKDFFGKNNPPTQFAEINGRS